MIENIKKIKDNQKKAQRLIRSIFLISVLLVGSLFASGYYYLTRNSVEAKYQEVDRCVKAALELYESTSGEVTPAMILEKAHLQGSIDYIVVTDEQLKGLVYTSIDGTSFVYDFDSGYSIIEN